MTELGPQAAYEAYLEQGRFMIQRSRSTGEYVFWPRVLAPSGATDLEWVPAKGTGVVHAITVNRARSGSWNVALIELDEGVRMMSTLPDVETAPIDHGLCVGDQPPHGRIWHHAGTAGRCGVGRTGLGQSEP